LDFGASETVSEDSFSEELEFSSASSLSSDSTSTFAFFVYFVNLTLFFFASNFGAGSSGSSGAETDRFGFGMSSEVSLIFFETFFLILLAFLITDVSSFFAFFLVFSTFSLGESLFEGFCIFGELDFFIDLSVIFPPTDIFSVFFLGPAPSNPLTSLLTFLPIAVSSFLEALGVSASSSYPASCSSSELSSSLESFSFCSFVDRLVFRSGRKLKNYQKKAITRSSRM
jgi:hypothetical protein